MDEEILKKKPLSPQVKDIGNWTVVSKQTRFRTVPNRCGGETVRKLTVRKLTGAWNPDNSFMIGFQDEKDENDEMDEKDI